MAIMCIIAYENKAFLKLKAKWAKTVKNVKKQCFLRKMITFRKIRTFDFVVFKENCRFFQKMF